MSDNQWPRYEVFVQERANRPHQNAGSVHAPDAEMALQNARDLFVRRPQCLSLWVVPAETILARSRQELDIGGPAGTAEGELETYYVFRKTSQRNTMTYVAHSGQVEAASAEEALANARRQFGDEETYIWWVCPERAITRSAEDDLASMFAPAADKAYRMPQDYRVAREMMAVKLGRRSQEADSK
ncbi:MAG: phenylacetic acid degradation protein [Chloroflexota bacterium]|nr:MAG: phenylacetic acid degradation protein [Chloroflexota bacterium]